MPGAILHDFQVEALLGRGTMAEVYLVQHQLLRSRYALKVLRPDLGAGRGRRQLVRRFLQEGSLQSQLRHPNLLRSHNIIDVYGTPGIVLDYIDGPTLEAFIQTHHPISIERIDLIARAIFRGVQAAHAAGIIHRDLKPANILISLVDGVPVPVIADFGIAKAAAWDQTRTGMCLGTPAYMPPEQIADAKNVDCRVDVHAIGAILFELVLGQRLVDTEEDSPEPLAPARGADQLETRRDLPERMKAAIVGALHPREHRIADGRSLAERWDGPQPRPRAPRAQPGDPWHTLVTVASGFAATLFVVMVCSTLAAIAVTLSGPTRAAEPHQPGAEPHQPGAEP